MRTVHKDHGAVIVRATVQHVDLLTPMFDGYRQFYKQPPDSGQARRFLRERLERDESVVFLAIEDEAGVGFTQLYPSYSSVSVKRVWILNDLFVVPEARQRGIASALLLRAEQFAVETQARGLELKTAKDNPAQRLYERMGWQRNEAFHHYSRSV
jgi:GNAT superfamily N-acetyltransferase